MFLKEPSPLESQRMSASKGLSPSTWGHLFIWLFSLSYIFLLLMEVAYLGVECSKTPTRDVVLQTQLFCQSLLSPGKKNWLNTLPFYLDIIIFLIFLVHCDFVS